MFDFFALVVALVAFIFARKAFNQLDAVRARLDAIETAGLRIPVSDARPVAETDVPIAPLAADEVGPDIAKQAEPEPASPSAVPDVPPPIPQAGPGFEERVGTRWVVWI